MVTQSTWWEVAVSSALLQHWATSDVLLRRLSPEFHAVLVCLLVQSLGFLCFSSFLTSAPTLCASIVMVPGVGMDLCLGKFWFCLFSPPYIRLLMFIILLLWWRLFSLPLRPRDSHQRIMDPWKCLACLGPQCAFGGIQNQGIRAI